MGYEYEEGLGEEREVYFKVLESHDFDLLIGDETYDILIAMVNDSSYKKIPFVVIYDVLGLDASNRNPIDQVATYLTNRLWVKFLRSRLPLADRSIFIGELEDVPDKSFGFLLPNRRKLAERVCDFVGYIVPEDIENFKDKSKARQFLGYGKEPLIVCSIGGTSAGRDLLDLCIRTFPLIRARIPSVQMVLVCGPRVPPESVKAPEGVRVSGYVPNLYRHLGAADLCIVSGGGTITLELTTL
jgi:UDP:flavonoid glycosyltransferase YjiC (YdhE family)